MSDQGLEEGLQRLVQANARYYEALGQVTADYVKALAGIWASLGLPVNLGALNPAGTVQRPAAPPVSLQAPPVRTPALLLEAAAGDSARGAFVVANNLARRVSAPVVTSPFTDPSGREIRPELRVEPEVVTLDPGAQALVQVAILVGEELAPEVDYRAEIGVPGLSDGRVPVVLRRRAAAAPARSARPAGGGSEGPVRRVAPKKKKAAAPARGKSPRRTERRAKR